jgi:hypothetical protein
MYEIDRTHYNNTFHQPGGPISRFEWVDRPPTIELHEDENGNVSTASYISYYVSSLLLLSFVLYMLSVV